MSKRFIFLKKKLSFFLCFVLVFQTGFPFSFRHLKLFHRSLAMGSISASLDELDEYRSKVENILSHFSRDRSVIVEDIIEVIYNYVELLRQENRIVKIIDSSSGERTSIFLNYGKLQLSLDDLSSEARRNQVVKTIRIAFQEDFRSEIDVDWIIDEVNRINPARSSFDAVIDISIRLMELVQDRIDITKLLQKLSNAQILDAEIRSQQIPHGRISGEDEFLNKLRDGNREIVQRIEKYSENLNAIRRLFDSFKTLFSFDIQVEVIRSIESIIGVRVDNTLAPIVIGSSILSLKQIDLVTRLYELLYKNPYSLSIGSSPSHANGSSPPSLLDRILSPPPEGSFSPPSSDALSRFGLERFRIEILLQELDIIIEQAEQFRRSDAYSIQEFGKFKDRFEQTFRIITESIPQVFENANPTFLNPHNFRGVTFPSVVYEGVMEKFLDKVEKFGRLSDTPLFEGRSAGEVLSGGTVRFVASLIGFFGASFIFDFLNWQARYYLLNSSKSPYPYNTFVDNHRSWSGVASFGGFVAGHFFIDRGLNKIFPKYLYRGMYDAFFRGGRNPVLSVRKFALVYTNLRKIFPHISLVGAMLISAYAGSIVDDCLSGSGSCSSFSSLLEKLSSNEIFQETISHIPSFVTASIVSHRVVEFLNKKFPHSMSGEILGRLKPGAGMLQMILLLTIFIATDSLLSPYMTPFTHKMIIAPDLREAKENAIVHLSKYVSEDSGDSSGGWVSGMSWWWGVLSHLSDLSSRFQLNLGLYSCNQLKSKALKRMKQKRWDIDGLTRRYLIAFRDRNCSLNGSTLDGSTLKQSLNRLREAYEGYRGTIISDFINKNTSHEAYKDKYFTNYYFLKEFYRIMFLHFYYKKDSSNFITYKEKQGHIYGKEIQSSSGSSSMNICSEGDSDSDASPTYTGGRKYIPEDAFESICPELRNTVNQPRAYAFIGLVCGSDKLYTDKNEFHPRIHESFGENPPMITPFRIVTEIGTKIGKVSLRSEMPIVKECSKEDVIALEEDVIALKEDVIALKEDVIALDGNPSEEIKARVVEVAVALAGAGAGALMGLTGEEVGILERLEEYISSEKNEISRAFLKAVMQSLSWMVEGIIKIIKIICNVNPDTEIYSYTQEDIQSVFNNLSTSDYPDITRFEFEDSEEETNQGVKCTDGTNLTDKFTFERWIECTLDQNLKKRIMREVESIKVKDYFISRIDQYIDYGLLYSTDFSHKIQCESEGEGDYNYKQKIKEDDSIFRSDCSEIDKCRRCKNRVELISLVNVRIKNIINEIINAIADDTTTDTTADTADDTTADTEGTGEVIGEIIEEYPLFLDKVSSRFIDKDLLNVLILKIMDSIPDDSSTTLISSFKDCDENCDFTRLKENFQNVYNRLRETDSLGYKLLDFSQIIKYLEHEHEHEHESLSYRLSEGLSRLRFEYWGEKIDSWWDSKFYSTYIHNRQEAKKDHNKLIEETRSDLFFEGEHISNFVTGEQNKLIPSFREEAQVYLNMKNFISSSNNNLSENNNNEAEIGCLEKIELNRQKSFESTVINRFEVKNDGVQDKNLLELLEYVCLDEEVGNSDRSPENSDFSYCKNQIKSIESSN